MMMSMKRPSLKRPARLQKGDRIRLVAPASPFDRKAFAAGVAALEKMGFEPVWERAELQADGFLTGTDADRAKRLMDGLTERDTAAVWCIRGGYGTTRLLPHLKFGRIRKAGKLLIGFSDITSLLLNLHQRAGLACVHGPVITQLGRVPGGKKRWLMKLLTQDTAGVLVPLGKVGTLNRGRAEGRLVGGNLSVLASLVGTPWMPSLRGAILFVEDVGEGAYRLDRLFTQLMQAGALRGLRGVVIGRLADCRPERGRHSARAVLDRSLGSLGLPAISGAPFGHLDSNLALPVGVRARLNAGKKSLTLLDGLTP